MCFPRETSLIRTAVSCFVFFKVYNNNNVFDPLSRLGYVSIRYVIIERAPNFLLDFLRNEQSNLIVSTEF